jgi:type I restriction enzyme M protein
MESRKLRVFDDEDLKKATDTYHAWRNATKAVSSSDSAKAESYREQGDYQNEPGFCYTAKLEEIAKQDYKLTPGIYVGTEAVEDDGIPFEDKMETLKAQLQKQFEKGNELQKQILDNFEKF